MKPCIIVLLLLLVTFCYGAECKKIAQPKDIPCQITSTWNYTAPCSSHNATILNSTGNNFLNLTFGEFGKGLCNLTWNISTAGSYTGIVDNGDTFNILIEVEDDMTSLAVIIFLLALNLVIFLIPFYVQLSKGEITNIVLKKCFHIMAVLLLWLNIHILRVIADRAVIGINAELNTLFLIVSLAMVLLLYYLLYSMMASVVATWKEMHKRRMFGE